MCKIVNSSVARTSPKMHIKRIMFVSMRPSEICSGPTTSQAHKMYVIRTKEIHAAIVNVMSARVLGSAAYHHCLSGQSKQKSDNSNFSNVSAEIFKCF